MPKRKKSEISEEEGPVDYSKWTVAKLKAALKDRGADTKGKKAELLQRLTELVEQEAQDAAPASEDPEPAEAADAGEAAEADQAPEAAPEPEAMEATETTEAAPEAAEASEVAPPEEPAGETVDAAPEEPAQEEADAAEEITLLPPEAEAADTAPDPGDQPQEPAPEPAKEPEAEEEDEGDLTQHLDFEPEEPEPEPQPEEGAKAVKAVKRGREEGKGQEGGPKTAPDDDDRPKQRLRKEERGQGGDEKEKEDPGPPKPSIRIDGFVRSHHPFLFSLLGFPLLTNAYVISTPMALACPPVCLPTDIPSLSTPQALHGKDGEADGGVEGGRPTPGGGPRLLDEFHQVLRLRHLRLPGPCSASTAGHCRQHMALGDR